MDHWTVLSPDGRVLAVEEGQRRSKRGKDYVRGRSGCVEPAHRPGGEFTPHFGRGPIPEFLHHLVQLGAYPGDLALADARHAQGLYQLVHLARADAENVGLLDDSHQRFLGAAPWLQQAREIASLPQFGNAKVDGAHPRLPSTLTVAVAMRHTLRRPLVTVRTDLAAHLDLHQQLNRCGPSRADAGACDASQRQP